MFHVIIHLDITLNFSPSFLSIFLSVFLVIFIFSSFFLSIIYYSFLLDSIFNSILHTISLLPFLHSAFLQSFIIFFFLSFSFTIQFYLPFFISVSYMQPPRYYSEAPSFLSFFKYHSVLISHSFPLFCLSASVGFVACIAHPRASRFVASPLLALLFIPCVFHPRHIFQLFLRRFFFLFVLFARRLGVPLLAPCVGYLLLLFS